MTAGSDRDPLTALSVNDEIVTTRAFGGLCRPFIPVNTPGRVTYIGSPAGTPTRARFVINSIWNGTYEVEVEVYPGEIRPAGNEHGVQRGGYDARPW